MPQLGFNAPVLSNRSGLIELRLSFMGLLFRSDAQPRCFSLGNCRMSNHLWRFIGFRNNLDRTLKGCCGLKLESYLLARIASIFRLCDGTFARCG